MASGKQLSFQHGEVSPSLRFRSDAVSYASGLAKLTNMYVRKAGGVSNRQGFEFVEYANSQELIPSYGGIAGVKGFTFWSASQNKWVTLEAVYDGTNFQVLMDGISLSLSTLENIKSLNLLKIKFTTLRGAVLMTPSMGLGRIGDPSIKRDVVLAVRDNVEKTGFYFGASLDPYVGDTQFNMANLSFIDGGGSGSTPYLPVTYLVTASMKDGQELKMFSICSVGYTQVQVPIISGIAYPHAALTTYVNFALKNVYDDILNINFYRAAGAAVNATAITAIKFGDEIPRMYYKLAGKQRISLETFSVSGNSSVGSPTITGIASTAGVYSGMLANVSGFPEKSIVVSFVPNTSITLNSNSTISSSVSVTLIENIIDVTFTDYGADTPSLTPPVEDQMLKSQEDGTGFKYKALTGVNAAAYYQQRLILAMKSESNGKSPVGTINVSKIGAPEQLKSPTIFSDTGAFEFNIPITDGTECIALLAMERLIAFTESGVYIIRGGEQGVLTPTAINPLIVSEEGCSKVVEPKMSGRRGYFVNNSHTKLMAIEFGVDGNMEMFEASIFSDHLLFKDILQIEVLSGSENTIHLLRKDGKIVQVTTNDERVSGFSLVETEGYIESIFKGKALKPYSANSVNLSETEKYYDVLMCYIIRNGHRILERLNFREDKYREGEFFADCYESFGMRLSEFGNEGYTKIGAPDSNNPRINIETSVLPAATRWLAGSPITIWCTQANIYLPDIDNAGGVIHFFYDDAEGNTQFLRYIKNPYSIFATGDALFTQGFTGYFEADVPESLRDARNQSVSLLEQKRLQTRWAPALNYIPSASLEGVKFAAFKNPLSFGGEQAAVSIMADGEVISSPNNPYKPTLYLNKDYYAEVEMRLPDYYTYGYIGIPYTSEFETLDLEAGGEKTLTDAKKLLNAVGVGFNESRGGFFGMPNQDLTNMEEIQPREDEDFSNQSKNTSGHLVVNVPAGWNEAGRVNIKQVDPAPITILSVYPKGISGD